MSAAVVLRPGLAPLAYWGAIYRGASLELDPVSRADVEAGKAALSTILSGNGLLPPLDLASESPSIAELIEKRGQPMPTALLSLFVALKLASLAQGMSGVRWSVVRTLADFFSHGFLPSVPAETVSDRLALSHLFAALTGTGEILHRGRIRPAAEALREADLRPLTLNPRERNALLSGTQLSLATALAGLFDAERVFQSAVVAAALSAAAKGYPDAPLHPRVHRLHRQRGQIEVAAAFAALLGNGDAEPAQAAGSIGSEEKANCSAPLRLGACLDLLRQAGATLERATNAVVEDRLVLWQSEEIVAGVEDLSSVAMAAGQITLALRTLGDLSAERAVVAEAAEPTEGNDARGPTTVAPHAVGITTGANANALDPAVILQLPSALEIAARAVATEFLEATRTAEAEGREGLDRVQHLVRETAPQTADGAAEGVAAISKLVHSGALAAAAQLALPSVAPSQRTARRLGGQAKRK